MSAYSRTAALNLEKSLSKLRGEIVKYSMSNAPNMDVVQQRLADFGRHVGQRMVHIVNLRTNVQKREIRLLGALVFLKTTFWKHLFGKEADDLEQDGVDEHISVPLNTAIFNAGVVEACLTSLGFPCSVTCIWYKGTAYAIKFEDSVIVRKRQVDGE